MLEIISELIANSGFAALSGKSFIMIVIACVLLYLGIRKQYEPYLMIPIAFGMLLSNLPISGIMAPSIREGYYIIYIKVLS